LLVEELKSNSRLLWLVTEEDASIDDVIGDLSTEVYDRLLAEGFNFNSIGKRKISLSKKLKKTNLRSWHGKSTEELMINVYDKIKNILELYPRSRNNPKRRWPVRIINAQKRILLLVKFASS